MYGVHELGGMDANFGEMPISDPNEPTFFTEWEERTFGTTLAAAYAGLLNFDEFRYGIERMPAWQFYAARYYEKWTETLETNMIEKGVVTREEVDARIAKIKSEG